MRLPWPWRRHDDDAESSESAEAVKAAQERADKEAERLAEARRVAASLRRLRAENHFGEALEQAFRGR